MTFTPKPISHFQVILLGIFLFFNTSTGFAQLPMGGVYTVGGESPDYFSIAAAISALGTNGVSEPVTIKIRNGVYEEKLSIPQIIGTSSSNRVVFTSETNNADDVLIKSTGGGSVNHWVLQINGASYITIKNLSVENTSTSYASGIQITTSSSAGQALENIVENCKIILSKTPGIGVVGITISSVNMTGNTSGITVNNNIIRNNEIHGGRIGVEVRSSILATMVGNQILSNTIFAVENGVNSIYNISGEVSNNIIKFLPSTLTTDAVGINIQRGTKTVFSNNFVLGGFGDRGGAGIKLNFPEDNIMIYHNSIIFDGKSDGAAFYILPYQTIDILNNNFINSSGGYAFFIEGTAAYREVITSNYNNLFTTGDNIGFYTSNQKTLSDYQTASGKEQNSISINPIFIDPGNDLHTFDPGLDGKGTPIMNSSEDIDGEPRDAVAPDIGADEFTPNELDISILDVTTTANPKVGNTNEVVVTLKNEGVSSLNGKTVPLQFSADLGQTWITAETFTPSQLDETFSTESYVFQTKWDIEKIGSGRIFVRVEPPGMVGDANLINDTLSRNLCIEFEENVYTIGGVTPDFTSIQQALDLLSCNEIKNTITFNIRQGTYNEKIVIPSIAGTSLIKRIVFQSESGNPDDVIIEAEGGGDLDDHFVIQLDGARFVSLKNLTIKNKSTGLYISGVHLTNEAFGNTISGCRIEMDTTGEGVTTSRVGILASSKNSFFGYSESASSTKIENNFIKNGAYGIYLIGTVLLPIKNNLIKGNIVEAASYMGIRSIYEDGIIISGNNVNLRSSSGLRAYPIYISESAGTFSVLKNKITNGSVYGIVIYRNPNTTKGLVANNMVAGGFKESENFKGGIYLGATKNTDVVFNSVVMDQNYSSGIVVGASDGAANRILNNNVENKGDGFAYYVSDVASLDETDFNNFYTKGEYIAQWGTEPIRTLDSLRIVSTMEAKSLSVDPGFLSPINLHTSNWELNGKGIPVSNVTDDYDGELRNNTSPDIGADEFGETGGRPPLAIFSFADNFLKITFTDLSENDPTSWLWDFDSNNPGISTSTDQNPVFSYAEEGSYKVCLTATNALGSDSSCKLLNVVNPPAPQADFEFVIMPDLTVEFTDLTINNPLEWSWIFGDGSANSSEQNPVHVFPEANVYTVTLIVANQTGSDVATKNVEIDLLSLVGSASKDFIIGPNPAIDYIQLSGVFQGRLTVVNLKGQTVIEKTISDTQTYRLDVSTLQNGIYFITLEGNKNKVKRVFVIGR